MEGCTDAPAPPTSLDDAETVAAPPAPADKPPRKRATSAAAAAAAEADRQAFVDSMNAGAPPSGEVRAIIHKPAAVDILHNGSAYTDNTGTAGVSAQHLCWLFVDGKILCAVRRKDTFAVLYPDEVRAVFGRAKGRSSKAHKFIVDHANVFTTAAGDKHLLVEENLFAESVKPKPPAKAQPRTAKAAATAARNTIRSGIAPANLTIDAKPIGMRPAPLEGARAMSPCSSDSSASSDSSSSTPSRKRSRADSDDDDDDTPPTKRARSEAPAPAPLREDEIPRELAELRRTVTECAPALRAVNAAWIDYVNNLPEDVPLPTLPTDGSAALDALVAHAPFLDALLGPANAPADHQIMAWVAKHAKNVFSGVYHLALRTIFGQKGKRFAVDAVAPATAAAVRAAVSAGTKLGADDPVGFTKPGMEQAMLLAVALYMPFRDFEEIQADLRSAAILRLLRGIAAFAVVAVAHDHISPLCRAVPQN